MNDKARINLDPRRCTCHPDDNPPEPCAQKHALRDCRIAGVARRLRYVADAVPPLEMAGELHSLARQLEDLV